MPLILNLPRIKCLIRLIFFILLFSLFYIPIYAQTERPAAEKIRTQIPAALNSRILKSQSEFRSGAGKFIPDWDSTRIVYIPSEEKRTAPSAWFQGAQTDPLMGNIPYYELKVLVSATEIKNVQSVIPGTSTQRFTADHTHVPGILGRDYPSDWYPAQPVVAGEVVSVRGQYWQSIRIYPVQVSRDGRTLREYKEINYTLGTASRPQMKTSDTRKTLASSSVLGSGDWYKIAVVREGVHVLDAAFLNALGINLSNLNPSSLRLFTQIPGILPQNTSGFRYDDLVEMPVMVQGENDGVFNVGDFLAFYAHSPHSWSFSTTQNKFMHTLNPYSDSAYYFLNINQAAGKRINNALMPSPNYVPGSVTAKTFYEQDLVNLIHTGRQWFGESFDLNSYQTFVLPVVFPHPDSLIRMTIQVAARASIPTVFSISVQGVQFGSIPVNNVILENSTGNYVNISQQTFYVPASYAVNGELAVNIGYNRPSSSQGTNGWLDYIEVEYAKQQVMSGVQQSFSVSKNIGAGIVHDISMAGMNSEHICWDVTDVSDIKNLPFSLNGSTGIMSTEADRIRDFVVFRNVGPFLLQPAGGVKIQNQNLHAQEQPQYILVTAPALIQQANQLADFHKNVLGQKVVMATTDQIYNEFSGGKQDISAIRDYVRMFYLRAGTDTSQMPSWLCLLGDASYDFRSRNGSSASALIPPYESRNSISFTNSFVSDDFYGFLDAGEGNWGEGTNGDPEKDSYENHGLDIGVGRLPAKNAAEAQALVNKIRTYASGNSNFGTWKNTVVMVADHKSDEGSLHVSQADSYSGLIQAQNATLNLDKVYLDYYKGVNSAEGFLRFPDAKDALIRSLDKGSLIVNYTGHGGELGWSNSRILEVQDINALNNGSKLPLYMTATCEFGRFDNPELTSGAELLFLKENGGSIAMFTTVRLVYSGPNQALNQNFYQHVFRKNPATQTWFTLGDVYRLTKNDTWTSGLNTRSFALLGDPGITLAYPKNNAVVKQVNSVPVSVTPDTLKALSLVNITGEVQYPNGIKIADFNGVMNVTVYDKPARYNTILSPFNFQWQRNRIFNGSVSVRNGEFTLQFKVPLDISYENGLGKVSLYFEDGYSDGAGFYTNLIIGGTDTTVAKDEVGPVLDLFMNDEKWADGGLVNQNPLLLSRIYDESGINTQGTGIGHEITAVLNRDDTKRIVLNDYYAAKKDSYQEGLISYQYKDLAEGNYDLELKVWDVANNSSIARTNFVVANNSKIALSHVLNYPNPFTTSTKFFFEHNQRGEMLQAHIRIFTVSGRLVKTLEHSFYGEASLNNDIQWDGLDDYGDRIGRGVYVYEVRLKVLRTGETAGKYEKLVILR